ncbi:MAG: adenylate/guanylate cyclase domain-containing protein [Ignavibacteria bacterium]|jgi:adenylate cyclase
MKNISDYDFEDLFFEERLKSEKFKELLLAIILVVIFIAITINSLYLELFKEDLSKAFVWFGLVLIVLILRTILIRRFQNFRKKFGRKKYIIFSYINTFIETSIPTVLIIIIAVNFDSHTALISPGVFFYFLFIILSIFELDLKLSVFSGMVAASEYLILSFTFIENVEKSGVMYVLTLQIYYIGKSIFLLLAGIVAGLIAAKIKNNIIESFSSIKEREDLQKIFGQQVSKEIVDEFIKNKLKITSRKREATVMFLDIREFSKYCEGKSPGEINQYQNKALGFMIEIINKNKGIVNQILGDGFMATFGAPVEDKDHTQNAVNSAIEIVKELRSKNDNNELPGTKIGIGIHTGEVVTGNVGTEERKQYSIAGNTVILAARLEQLNKELNTQIIVSKDVIDNMKAVKPECTSLGEVNLKGFASKVQVYKLT